MSLLIQPPLSIDAPHRMVILDESDVLVLEADRLRPAVFDRAVGTAKPTPVSHGSEGITALLSVRRVAEITMYSTKTVRRRIASGKLRAVYDQGLLRVRDDDLQAYLADLPERGTSNRARRPRSGSSGWSGL